MPHPGEAEHRVLEIVVVEILDRAAEPDRLLGRPHGVRIEPEAVARQRRGDGAIALEVVVGREDAAFQLVRSEPVLRLERPCVRDELIRRAHGAVAVGVGVAEEQIRRERHAIADAAAEDVADRHAPRLAEQIEARELERGDDLRAIVVERRRRIGEQEAHVLEAGRIAAEQRRLQREDRRDRRLAAAAHFAEADEAAVAFDLDDRAHESAPMAAVRMAQRRFERNRDRRRPHVGDFHGRSRFYETPHTDLAERPRSEEERRR